ncbi:hypothetical protein HDA32_004885 [Spinactinospora alkalitolerans]|uniref:Uncharacterized protein n=1 Tax=Spinactinospora alkalitolerans TaxID=687207 RepID=A0A852U2M2_9ACTN|nr:hypothetical protein [Spinactinospora alkalitolerans]
MQRGRGWPDIVWPAPPPSFFVPFSGGVGVLAAGGVRGGGVVLLHGRRPVDGNRPSRTPTPSCGGPSRPPWGRGGRGPPARPLHPGAAVRSGSAREGTSAALSGDEFGHAVTPGTPPRAPRRSARPRRCAPRAARAPPCGRNRRARSEPPTSRLPEPGPNTPPTCRPTDTTEVCRSCAGWDGGEAAAGARPLSSGGMLYRRRWAAPRRRSRRQRCARTRATASAGRRGPTPGSPVKDAPRGPHSPGNLPQNRPCT